MYTYIFDDKENEIALNNIKAIIFDVISREKAKQAVFRENVIGNADANAQNELFSIANAQEACLNDFIFVGNQIGEILKKVDYYSRNFNLSAMNNAQQNEMVSSYSNDGVEIGVGDTSYTGEQVGLNAPVSPEVVNTSVGSDSVDEQTVAEESEIFESDKEDAVEELVTPSEPAVDEDENLDDQKSEEVVEEKVEEASSEEIAEDKQDDNSSSDVSTDELVSEVVPEEASNSVQLVIPGASNEENTDAKEKADGSDVISDDEEDKENTSTQLIIPTVNTEKKEEEEHVPNIVNNPQQIIPDTNSDPMLDALLANDSNEDTKKEEPLITFKKRTSDLARAILTNAKQTASLRKSLSTQEALLSSRGFFENTKDNNLEQTLVDNGLLPADNNSQMEEMLKQANELYASGKLEEAQAMFDKISELNKQAQSGTAIAA